MAKLRWNRVPRRRVGDDAIEAWRRSMERLEKLPAPPPHRSKASAHRSAPRHVVITTGPLVGGCLQVHEFPSTAAARAAGFSWIKD